MLDRQLNFYFAAAFYARVRLLLTSANCVVARERIILDLEYFHICVASKYRSCEYEWFAVAFTAVACAAAAVTIAIASAALACPAAVSIAVAAAVNKTATEAGDQSAVEQPSKLVRRSFLRVSVDVPFRELISARMRSALTFCEQ